MGWSIGYDDNWQRDIGYGVPATCDHPECNAKIDRGLAHVCGGEPYGGEDGCGLYFCGAHLLPRRCERCSDRTDDAEFVHFEPKPDHPEWIEWKLIDPSWQQWREENRDQVEKMKAVLSTHAGEDR